jgi:hypothetical protein
MMELNYPAISSRLAARLMVAGVASTTHEKPEEKQAAHVYTHVRETHLDREVSQPYIPTPPAKPLDPRTFEQYADDVFKDFKENELKVETVSDVQQELAELRLMH